MRDLDKQPDELNLDHAHRLYRHFADQLGGVYVAQEAQEYLAAFFLANPTANMTGRETSAAINSITQVARELNKVEQHLHRKRTA